MGVAYTQGSGGCYIADAGLYFQDTIATQNFNGQVDFEYSVSPRYGAFYQVSTKLTVYLINALSTTKNLAIISSV